jgi:hypothetical protein
MVDGCRRRQARYASPRLHLDGGRAYYVECLFATQTSVSTPSSVHKPSSTRYAPKSPLFLARFPNCAAADQLRQILPIGPPLTRTEPVVNARAAAR